MAMKQFLQAILLVKKAVDNTHGLTTQHIKRPWASQRAHGQKLDYIPFNRRTAKKLNQPRDLGRAAEPGLNR
jgi:hypothetical protein